MSTEYRINYFEQIKFFYSVVFANQLDIRPVHTSLYMFLLNQNNRINWVEWFKCPYDVGMIGAQINSKNTYYKALDELVSFNLIEYEKGINLHKAPKIKIIPANSTVSKINTLTAPLCEKVTGNLSGNLSDTITDNLSNTLNGNIYKLITNNLKTINHKHKEIEIFLNEIIKENEEPSLFGSEIPKGVIYPYNSEEFISQWNIWKSYKKKKKSKFLWTIETEQSALQKLTKVSTTEQGAIDVIHEAMANGWETFYKLKNQSNNGQQKSTTEQFRDAYNSEAARNFKYSQ